MSKLLSGAFLFRLLLALLAILIFAFEIGGNRYDFYIWLIIPIIFYSWRRPYVKKQMAAGATDGGKLPWYKAYEAWILYGGLFAYLLFGLIMIFPTQWEVWF